MAKNKKAQDGTALPRSLDPRVKAAVAADKQRIKQGTIKSTEPFKPKDTRHWQSDSKAKERINSYKADIALQTAIDQVPYAPYALAAMAFNQGRPLTALSELIKLPGGWPIDAAINVTQENPAGIDIKTFEDKTIPFVRLAAGAPFLGKSIIEDIGKQVVTSGEKPNSKWYSRQYNLPGLFEASKSLGVDDNTLTKFIENNWESSGGSYKKVLDAAKKQFSKKQQGGSVESYMGGLTDKGFNYNGAWGGTMQMGGNLPGAVGFTYARTGSIPSNGKYAKKTKASAEEGMEILPDPTDPDRKYKLSAIIASAKDILNPLLRAKDPAKYDAWTKGRVATLREKGMPAMREYMEQNPISIYLSPQEVKTALSKQREGFYEDYIGAIRGLRDYESEIGTPMRKTLYGGKEGQGELENLNYGWRFATLPVNLSKQTTTTSGKPIPEESFMYSYDATKDEYKKTPYYENGGKMMSYYQAGLDFQPKTISKKGSKIKKDNDGYWNPENWGKPVEIDSNEITMEGVYQPLIGVSDTGDVQYMEPGENYTFDGESVTEYPVARKGVSVNKADEAPLKKLDQLLNFTNYNDMKKAKKGKNIPKAQAGISALANPAFTSAIQGAVDFQGGYDDYISSVDKKGKGAGMSQFSMPGSLGASPLAKDIEFLGMAKQALKERKKAKQSLAVSEVVKQAATMRPDIQKRKYVRPEDNLLQPDQMGMMPYGGGYDVLGMAENGMQIGGNLTEIQNMYNPGTLYDNLGYEPLDESSKVKQFKKGGGIPKAQMGIQEAGMELLSLGQGLRNQAILGAINKKTEKWTEQATQNLQQGAMNQALQTQFSPFMKDGGSLDVSDEYKWISHSWQPQVITKFGEYNVKDLLKPDPMMDTLRTGGNIRSNYMGDDEMVRSMAMGGNLQTHWGGEGEVMSYNPYMPGSGETVMLKGNSHEESDGQGNTGVGMSYSGNMVEAERGEPVVEMQEGGAVGDTSAVVFGNMKIPSYGISELQDSKAKGKKFKTYASDLAKKEKKQSKIVDKATSIINNIEGDSPYDMLKMNAAQAMLMGADMSLKDLANKKKTLAGVQNAILETAEEMGLESDALARGKIMKAKKGANIPKGQQGMYIPQPGLSSNLTERKRLIDAGRKIIEDLYNAGETGTPPNLYTDEDFLKIGEKNVGKTLDEVKVVGRKKPTAPRQLSESVYLPTMEAFEKAYKDVVPKTSPSINQQGFNLYIPIPGGVSPNMGQLTFSERQSAPITPTASVAAPVSRKVQSAPTKKQTTAAAKQKSPTTTAAKQEQPLPYTPAYIAKTLQANLSTPEFMQPVDFSKSPFEYTPQGLPESGLTAEDYLRYGVQPEAPSFKSEYYSTPEGKKIENEKKAGNKIKDFLSQNEGLFSALYNEALPYLRPSNQMQLQPEQLAGEMFALSTNVLQGVSAQTYQPLLETRAPQMSAQEQLNQNQADFNAMLRQVGNNPAALSVLAAQKQAADRQAIAQTQAYNTQQAIAANNRNIAMLNDASLKNLGILDTQYQRQEGAKANTKAQAQAALSSIASKIGQNKLENLTSAVMQNMYNFRFGPKGRIINYNPLARFQVPEITDISPEEAQIIKERREKMKQGQKRNGSVVKAIKGL